MKIKIALSVVIVILLWLVLSKDEIVKTVTKTTIEFIPEVSQITISKPKEIKLIKIKVPVTVESTVTDTTWMDKEVKEYSYLDSLPNGIIRSKIIADNIYKRSVELETFTKTITKETTNTIVQNSIFLNFGANRYVNKDLRDINISVDFTKKNKWRLGAVVGYDLTIEKMFYGVKFGIPLN